MILVKVAKDKRVTEFAFENGTALNDLLIKANLKHVMAEHIKVNDQYVGLNVASYVLRDRDLVSISEKKPCTVRIAKIGQPLHEQVSTEGFTVNQVLAQCGKLPCVNEEVWVHYDGIDKGERIGLCEIIRPGMILIVEAKKKASLEQEVENYLKNRYGVVSNKLYTNDLISLIKNFRY